MSDEVSYETYISYIQNSLVDGALKNKVIEIIKRAKLLEEMIKQFVENPPELREVNIEDITLHLTVGIKDAPVTFIAIPYTKYQKLTQQTEGKT